MKRHYKSASVCGRVSLDHHAVLSAHAEDCGRPLGTECRMWLEAGSLMTTLSSLYAPGVEKFMPSEDLDAVRERVRRDLAAHLNRALPHAVTANAMYAGMASAN